MTSKCFTLVTANVAGLATMHKKVSLEQLLVRPGSNEGPCGHGSALKSQWWWVLSRWRLCGWTHKKQYVTENWCDSRCYVHFKKWLSKIGESHLNELPGLNDKNTEETRNSTVLMRKSHSCVVGHLCHGWLCVGVSDFVQLWWTRRSILWSCFSAAGSLQCCPTSSAIHRPRIKPIFRICFCIFKGLSAHMHWNQGPLVNILCSFCVGMNRMWCWRIWLKWGAG